MKSEINDIRVVNNKSSQTMIEVILSIKIPNLWANDISTKYSVPIKFLDCIPHGENGGRVLVQIDSKDELVSSLISDIQKHPNVCNIDLLSSGNGRVLGSVATTKCAICRLLTGSDCFLVSAMTRLEGWVEWTLAFTTDEAISKLIRDLEETGYEVRVLKKGKLAGAVLLTQRQEEVIEMAFEKGYYDYPRRTTLKDLASELRIAPATLWEILHRGERKIISRYVELQGTEKASH